jgi:hypothetical protein
MFGNDMVIKGWLKGTVCSEFVERHEQTISFSVLPSGLISGQILI